MLDKEHDPEGNQPNTRSDTGQDSPSLLPAILSRLGHAHEQRSPSEWRALLGSHDWEMRVAAVRALGKAANNGDTNVSEWLIPALADDDASVRAAAISVLGSLGQQTLLHRLIAALHDSDWHVRETAVLALARQGKRVPREAIKKALFDEDSSVREAAYLALRNLDEKSSETATSKTAKEYSMMQQTHDQPAPFHTVRSLDLPPSGNGRFRQGKPRVVREQAEGFDSRVAAQQHVPQSSVQSHAAQTFNAEMAGMQGQQMQEPGAYVPNPRHIPDESKELPHGFVESYRPSFSVAKVQPRRSNKGWWIALVITTIIAFLFGFALAMGVMSFSANRSGATAIEPIISKTAPNEAKISFQESSHDIMQNALSEKLHTDTYQLQWQWKHTKEGLVGIAQKQGMTADDLHAFELQTLETILNNEVISGHRTRADADKMLAEFRKDPTLIDQAVWVLMDMENVA